MLLESDFTLLLKAIEDCSEKLRIDGQNEWIRYIEQKMTPEEKDLYNSASRNSLVNFTETTCGKYKLQFLENYLKSDSDTQAKFASSLLKIFTSNEFAVLAVRLKSVELINLALRLFEISIQSNDDFRDGIVSLTLIYNALNLLGLNADEFLTSYANSSINNSTKDTISDFVSRKSKNKTLWCMGYEIVTGKDFGFVWIGNDPDYKSKKPKTFWWKFW